MNKFKIGDIVKVKSNADGYADGYKDVTGTVYHIDGDLNITIKPDEKFISDLDKAYSGTVGSCIDDYNLWYFDKDTLYGSNPEIISNYSFEESDLYKRVKLNKLTKKLFPDAIEEDGWLWI